MNEKQAVDVNRIASAIARELTPKGGPPPSITVSNPEALAIGGSVDVEIKINGVKYTLIVAAPTEQRPAWAFEVSMQTGEAPPVKLAAFSYNPTTSKWDATVSVPRIEVNPNFVIEKIAINLGSA
jgi:hypothetical protein